MKSWKPIPAKPGLWLVVAVLLCHASIHAQKTFTITDCINYAFEHNPLLNVATKDISIAEIDVKRTTGTYLPRANFVSAFQYYFTKRNLLIEGGSTLAPPTLAEGEPLAIKTGYNNSWYPSVGINQLIFNPAYRSSYNIAVQNQALQGQQLSSFKIDLITGIYRAYNSCNLFLLQANFLEKNVSRFNIYKKQ